MSSPAVRMRGASVLAALVLAAIMASVALLVQEGSPVASIQRQAMTAADAAPATAGANSGGSSSNVACDPLYDYKVDLNDPKKPIQTRVNVCDKQGDTTALRRNVTCSTGSGGIQSPPAGSKSEAQVCQSVGGKHECKPYECQKGDPVMKGAAQAVGSATAEALADGKLTLDQAAQLKNDLAANSGDQAAFNSAFDAGAGETKDQLAEEAKAKAAASDEASQAYENLKAFSDSQCSSGYVTTGSCEGITNKVDELKNKAEAAGSDAAAAAVRLENLDSAKSVLAPSDTPADERAAQEEALAFCKASPADCDLNGQPKIPPGQQPPASRTPGNGNPTGFGGNNGSGGGGNPMGGQQPQQQRPAQQSPSQQQCQPQYQCTTNGSISTATGAMPVSVVMYNQCPQQGAQWQQYQQCPQGYSCQNNGCVAVAPYGYCSDGRTPRTGPAQQQPPASSCTVGTWTDASNGCQTNWQCTNGSGSNGSMTAQLSCQPLVATGGTTITFSYACAGGATMASSTGFTLPSATTLSGTASTVLQKPASGSVVTYALTCTNASVTPNTTAGAQCTVQVGKSSIVLVATPEKISKAETDDTKKKSTIGWVTSGMQSCIISNQDFPEWTTQQASNTSVGGAVVSPAITADTTFKLTCQTLGGTEASSTVKVLSI